MKRATILAVFGLVLVLPTVAGAQESAEAGPQLSDDVRTELRRLNAEARAHADAGRHALAFDGFMALHSAMQQHGLPRASVALWNAGLALMNVPGREREARETLQRFLEDSTGLAGETDVAEFRSNAVARIAELDARIGEEPAETHDLNTSTSTQSSGIAPAGPIVLAGGLAVLIAGAIVGAVVLVQDDSLAAMCPDDVCPESARGFVEEVENLAIATDVLVISGAVITTAGIILSAVLREESPTLTAGCGPQGCAVGARGRF